MESLNWLTFLYIMEFTLYRIENDKNLLPSLLEFLKCLRLNVCVIKGKIFLKSNNNFLILGLALIYLRRNLDMIVMENNNFVLI